jgi:hypothetical protein
MTARARKTNPLPWEQAARLLAVTTKSASVCAEELPWIAWSVKKKSDTWW